MSRRKKKLNNKTELKIYGLANFVNEKTFSPIKAGDVIKIADAAINILTEIGMSDAPEELCDLILKHGGRLEGKQINLSFQLN